MAAVQASPAGRIVAVVITVDRADTASQCVAALLHGSMIPDAIVVVDNGSTVPYSVPTEYRERTRIIRLEHNAGPPAAQRLDSVRPLTKELTGCG